MNFPTIKDLTTELINYRDYLRKNYDPKDIEDEEGNAGGDCRLQVQESGWHLNTGCSDYDQSHKGIWGCSFVNIKNTKAELKEIAADLIDQAKEDYSQNTE
jgi:hypothetical protein